MKTRYSIRRSSKYKLVRRKGGVVVTDSPIGEPLIKSIPITHDPKAI